jgi:hypothetical protein
MAISCSVAMPTAQNRQLLVLRKPVGQRKSKVLPQRPTRFSPQRKNANGTGISEEPEPLGVDLSDFPVFKSVGYPAAPKPGAAFLVADASQSTSAGWCRRSRSGKVAQGRAVIRFQNRFGFQIPTVLL